MAKGSGGAGRAGRDAADGQGAVNQRGGKDVKGRKLRETLTDKDSKFRQGAAQRAEERRAN